MNVNEQELAQLLFQLICFKNDLFPRLRILLISTLKGSILMILNNRLLYRTLSHSNGHIPCIQKVHGLTSSSYIRL